MKRNDFKQVVKIFSFWKIDKRKGNYTLPNGAKLSEYLQNLVSEILERNNLAIRSDGSVGEILNGIIFKPFGDETTTPEQQEKAVHALIFEMLS